MGAQQETTTTQLPQSSAFHVLRRGVSFTRPATSSSCTRSNKTTEKAVTTETTPFLKHQLPEVQAKAEAEAEGFTTKYTLHGYKTPTPIQKLAPQSLKTTDTIAIAPTGSGKTLAYIMAIMQHIKTEEKYTQAVIVAPVRELVAQIYRECSRINSNNEIEIQMATKKETKNKKIAQLIIATPARAAKLEKEALKDLKILILDEADQLLKSPHLETTDEFLQLIPKQAIKGLFSATMDSHTEELARQILHDPVQHVIGLKNGATKQVKQSLLYTKTEQGKRTALPRMFSEPPIIVFTQTAIRAQELYTYLTTSASIPKAVHAHAGVIHGDIPQIDREKTLTDFVLGRIWVLVCTDAMARGMDFREVKTVINYDLPTSGEMYVHRIGRTGRGNQTGIAVTFFSDEDLPSLRGIANLIRNSGCDVPGWTLATKKLSSKERKALLKAPVERDAILHVSLYDQLRAKKLKMWKEGSLKRKAENQKTKNAATSDSSDGE